VADWNPVARSIVTKVAQADDGGLILSDASLTSKWRVFSGFDDVGPGVSKRLNDQLIWSVSPDEWTVLGPRPDEADVVDLSHVRAMFRLTGVDASKVLAKICALNLGDDMFPEGTAARTLVAGVATELVRDDQDGVQSFLILPSRSFGVYLYEVILDAIEEFG
jgi:sarcosine oxidase, subunit alpha